MSALTCDIAHSVVVAIETLGPRSTRSGRGAAGRCRSQTEPYRISDLSQKVNKRCDMSEREECFFSKPEKGSL